MPRRSPSRKKLSAQARSICVAISAMRPGAARAIPITGPLMRER
ncbi:DUF3693 domain-containing protein [Sinorhizobium sp. GL28]